MKKLSQKRMVALELVKETGDKLCADFCVEQRLPPDWQIVYHPGRAISDYNGGGDRHEYDSVIGLGSQRSEARQLSATRDRVPGGAR